MGPSLPRHVFVGAVLIAFFLSLYRLLWGKRGFGGGSAGTAAAQCVMLPMLAEERETPVAPDISTCPQRSSLAIFSRNVVAFPPIFDFLPLFSWEGRMGVLGVVLGRACRFWLTIDTGGRNKGRSLSLRYISSLIVDPGRDISWMEFPFGISACVLPWARTSLDTSLREDIKTTLVLGIGAG